MDRPPQPSRLGTNVVTVIRVEMLAKVLAKHRLVGPTIWTVECACGGQEGVDYYTHIAAALDAALAAQEGERGGAEVAALSLLLRRSAREHLGIPEGDFWPSDVADAQARALIAEGWFPAGALRQHDAEVLRAAADEVTEDGGAWDVLALYVDEAGHPYALGGIQRWLRERADRIAGDQP